MTLSPTQGRQATRLLERQEGWGGLGGVKLPFSLPAGLFSLGVSRLSTAEHSLKRRLEDMS